ncbi:NAD(P)-binding domain protein [Ascosphaera apis ARSEF 7405]|uniref:precorrin-2 dehydrogenase n=1 Tax=Ascosphaera apis ARSEF 7405 TaxID=392613 RepID=A0A162IBM9_9EURO|nr:NAD(P)-binding domain protein [Ascosphaera apis ARSEF 7405]
MTSYPPVQPGGSLMIAWQVKGKNVLVVGGGEVAAGRILHALNADANVTVISPSPLNQEVAHRVSQGEVRHVNRKFNPDDLTGASEIIADGGEIDMVLTAIDDPKESVAIWHQCKELRIPVNVADVPEHCDFYFGSVYRDGPLQVMVSTNGNGPKMANLVKKRIQEALPEKTGAAINNVGLLRGQLRKIASTPEEGPKRMRWYAHPVHNYLSID